MLSEGGISDSENDTWGVFRKQRTQKLVEYQGKNPLIYRSHPLNMLMIIEISKNVMNCTIDNTEN